VKIARTAENQLQATGSQAVTDDIAVFLLTPRPTDQHFRKILRNPRLVPTQKFSRSYHELRPRFRYVETHWGLATLSRRDSGNELMRTELIRPAGPKQRATPANAG
jgi:hypothetical protein